MALTRSLNNYARKNNLVSEKEDNFTGDDALEGLTAVISVRIPNPQFEGQTKTKLGNSEVEGIVSSIVNDSLSAYFEENPSVANKAIEKAIKDVEQGRTLKVPEHLKNIKVKTAGGGADKDQKYVYPHDYDGHFVEQEYVPTSAKYYVPTKEGYEEVIVRRMESLREPISGRKRSVKSETK